MAENGDRRGRVDMSAIYDMGHGDKQDEGHGYRELREAPDVFSGFCPIEPMPKGRPKFTRQGVAYTPRPTREYESAVRNWMMELYGTDVEPMDGDLAARYEFLMPRPASARKYKWFSNVKPDLDNLVKAFQDAMDFKMKWDDGTVMGIMANDSRVSTMVATKRYVKPGERPGTYVTVQSATECVLVVGDDVDPGLLRVFDPGILRFTFSELTRLYKNAKTQSKTIMFSEASDVYVMLDGNKTPDSQVKAIITSAFPQAENMYVI